MSVTLVNKDSLALKVGCPKPGRLTVFRHLVKERKIRIGKLERSAYVGRFVDNRVAQ